MWFWPSEEATFILMPTMPKPPSPPTLICVGGFRDREPHFITLCAFPLGDGDCGGSLQFPPAPQRGALSLSTQVACKEALPTSRLRKCRQGTYENLEPLFSVHFRASLVDWKHYHHYNLHLLQCECQCTKGINVEGLTITVTFLCAGALFLFCY